MTDKHLLWWLFKAIDRGIHDPQEITDAGFWKKLDAPDWVLPAIRERHDAWVRTMTEHEG